MDMMNHHTSSTRYLWSPTSRDAHNCWHYDLPTQPSSRRCFVVRHGIDDNAQFASLVASIRGSLSPTATLVSTTHTQRKTLCNSGYRKRAHVQHPIIMFPSVSL